MLPLSEASRLNGEKSWYAEVAETYGQDGPPICEIVTKEKDFHAGFAATSQLTDTSGHAGILSSRQGKG